MDLYSKKEIIDANYQLAVNNIPESLIPIQKMLFINGKINEKPLKIFVDTGAQISVMSHSLTKELGIDFLIDYHCEGFIVGVGHTTKIGKIHYLEIEFEGNLKLPLSFTILKNDEFKIILGLDTMMSQGSLIDLKNKTITFGNLKLKFDGY